MILFNGDKKIFRYRNESDRQTHMIKNKYITVKVQEKSIKINDYAKKKKINEDEILSVHFQFGKKNVLTTWSLSSVHPSVSLFLHVSNSF